MDLDFRRLPEHDRSRHLGGARGKVVETDGPGAAVGTRRRARCRESVGDDLEPAYRRHAARVQHQRRTGGGRHAGRLQPRQHGQIDRGLDRVELYVDRHRFAVHGGGERAHSDRTVKPRGVDAEAVARRGVQYRRYVHRPARAVGRRCERFVPEDAAPDAVDRRLPRQLETVALQKQRSRAVVEAPVSGNAEVDGGVVELGNDGNGDLVRKCGFVERNAKRQIAGDSAGHPGGIRRREPGRIEGRPRKPRQRLADFARERSFDM